MTIPTGNQKLAENIFTEISKLETEFSQQNLAVQKGQIARSPGQQKVHNIIFTLLSDFIKKTDNKSVKEFVEAAKKEIGKGDFNEARNILLNGVRNQLLKTFPNLKEGEVKEVQSVSKSSIPKEPESVKPNINLLKYTPEQWYKVLKTVYDFHIANKEEEKSQKAIKNTVENVFPYLKEVFKSDGAVLETLQEIRKNVTQNHYKEAETALHDLLEHIDATIHPEAQNKGVIKDTNKQGENDNWTTVEDWDTEIKDEF